VRKLSRAGIEGNRHGARIDRAAIFDRWSELRLFDVVAYIQGAMPSTHAFYVGPEPTRDIVAYILEQSGVPAGKQPIAKDVTVLSQILITRSPRR
jgi:hypothetical protein